MINLRVKLGLVALAAAGAASIAVATVPGGGPATSDCYLEFGGVTATKGKTTVECTDGTACDLDGECNNSCTFAVQVCPNQTDPNLPKCTPPAGGLSSVKITKDKSQVTLNQLGLTGSACGAFPDGPVVPLKVKTNKKGTKYLKATSHITAVVLAQPGVKPKKDSDKLNLVCLPNPTPCTIGTTTTSTTSTTLPGVGPECSGPNPQGGPDQLNLFVTAGSDLDNGWTGVSHDFPVPVGTTVRFCLSNCDETTDSVCDGVGSTDVGGTPSLNGPTFGPPLPLVAGGIPVCVVNKYAESTITGTVNIQTGEINGSIHLNSEVWTTPQQNVCPKCSGQSVGAAGTCTFGPKKGQACVTEGVVTVNSDNPVISGAVYTLSSSCPPGGLGQTKVATLPINLDPLTTDMSTMTGSKPCPGQTQDDGCGGAACTASCPATPPLHGGLSQFCCNNTQHTPCFPTKTGTIVRTGQLEVATPTWPDPTYPKTGVGGTSGENLASVFCIAKTNSTIDGVSGLPGPGALILPVKQCYKKLGQTCP